jgi:hypothetical protein
MKTVSDETSALPERPNPADLVPEVPEDEVSLVEAAEENPGFIGNFLTMVFGAAVGFIAAGFLNSYLLGKAPSGMSPLMYTGLILAGEVGLGIAVTYFARGEKFGAMGTKVIQGAATGIALAGIGTFVTQLMAGSGTASPATSVANAPPNLSTGGLTRRNRAVTV